MGFRGLVYRLYARRLETSLSPAVIPRHVGVMCDGNRRWARSAGLLDVASGHQKGADKIFELLEWCREIVVAAAGPWLWPGAGLGEVADAALAWTWERSRCADQGPLMLRPVLCVPVMSCLR